MRQPPNDPQGGQPVTGGGQPPSTVQPDPASRQGVGGRQSPGAGYGRAESTEAVEPRTRPTGQPPADLAVETPTVRWETISHPRENLKLGEDDRVIASYFDLQAGGWNVLVVVQPREAEED